MKRTTMVIALAMVALLATSFFYATQEAEAQSGTRRGKQPHYDVLWSWLKRSNYQTWKGADGKAVEFQKGESPHGALVKIYLSSKAASNIKNLPHGSVVIKENYSPAKKLMAITVMQRSPRYDPKHNDWYYAKYMPNGKIARTPPEKKNMPIAGKFKSCIACHSGADGDDFSFFND